MSEEVQFGLPSSWVAASIADTGDYINGLGFKETDWGTEGLPIIRIQNLTDEMKPFNRTTRKVDPNFHVRRGDILVSWSATLDAFQWRGEEALLNQHIFKVIPNEDIVFPQFLFYLLRHSIEAMRKSAHLHGSTMKHISIVDRFWLSPCLFLPSTSNAASSRRSGRSSRGWTHRWRH